MRLTAHQIDVGVRRALNKFDSADTNNTNRLSKSEVDKFRGKGAAQLKKVFSFAGHIQSARDTGNGAIAARIVDKSTMLDAVHKLAHTLKQVAAHGEIHPSKLEAADAALARFIFATR
jgi:hypothetical protein